MLHFLQAAGMYLMKMLGLFKTVAFVTVGATCFSMVANGDSRDSNKLIYPNGKTKNKYVFVIGSHIHQKVQVKSIGTASQSPVRVMGGTEIDRSGRYTTKGILALDPSVTVMPGGH